MNYIDIVLSLILAVLTGFIIPLITNKLGEQKAAKIEKWTAVFVQAAEQVFGQGKGEDKKDFVMENLLMKFDVPIDEAEALVESEVLKLNLTEKK